MRISDSEVKKVLARESGAEIDSIVESIQAIGEEADQRMDLDLARQIAREVIAMPDREEVIADLKARIEAGTYNPTGDDIADAMIRRSIADRMR